MSSPLFRYSMIWSSSVSAVLTSDRFCLVYLFSVFALFFCVSISFMKLILSLILLSVESGLQAVFVTWMFVSFRFSILSVG